MGCRSERTVSQDQGSPLVDVTSEQPDIVLIFINGLRADSSALKPMEVFSKEFGKSPSKQFHAAYVQSSQTFPSFASFLTGRYVSAIPACGIPSSAKGTAPFCATIPQTRKTLPEVLSIYGYKTFLGSTAPASSLSNIPSRFQDYVASPPRGLMPGTLGPFRNMRLKVTDWWNANESSPRFMVLTADLGAALSRQERHLNLPTAPEARRVELQANYLKKAGLFGKEIKGLLEKLPAAKRPRMVVVSSLFGISLMEESGASNAPRQNIHSDILYDRVVRVPLMIYGAEASSWLAESEEPVELVDLFSTLVAAGGAVPPSAATGYDLRKKKSDGMAYGELGDMLYLRRDEQMLTIRSFSHGGSSLDPKLTDNLVSATVERRLNQVRIDPLQLDDLAGSRPEKTQELYDTLKEIRLGVAAPPNSFIDQKALKALRESGAFGYW